MKKQGLSKNLIERVLGGVPAYTVAELEEKFPMRNLVDGAMVTRFAPSPTGYMHIGGLYQMLIDCKLAKQSGGVFMLRIEDTDTSRKVDGAVELIMGTQFVFGLDADETQIYDAATDTWSDRGAYGPYRQSARRDIYHSVAAELLARGDAYPCFLTSDEMDDIRSQQSAAGLPTGIYGEWATWRDADELAIIAKLDAGEIPSIRLYSRGDPSKRIFCKDAVRGSISFPENNADEVIIKSNDGLPTYHFAHLVDDHFMRTTHVVRGEEWLPSFPLHIAMFNMMSWTPPAYIHTSTIDKIDDENGKQRKISKRKDPEANVEYFVKQGYPTNAVLDYLLNIVSSGYEDERAKNPAMHWSEYSIKIKKIPTSGALFDFQKLNWWAREDIARMSAADIYNAMDEWNPDGIVPARANSCGGIGASRTITDSFLRDNRDYLIKIFGIERDNPKRVRKDFVTWKQTLEDVGYFFDDEFAKCKVQSADIDLLQKFISTFDINDDKDTWWNKIVQIAADNNVKNGEVAMALRVALTGRTNTPDLYSIMQVMGDARVRTRIENVIKKGK